MCSIFKFKDQTRGGRVCYQANLYITHFLVYTYTCLQVEHKFFHEGEVPTVDFFMFSAAKASERAGAPNKDIVQNHLT